MQKIQEGWHDHSTITRGPVSLSVNSFALQHCLRFLLFVQDGFFGFPLSCPHNSREESLVAGWMSFTSSSHYMAESRHRPHTSCKKVGKSVLLVHLLSGLWLSTSSSTIHSPTHNLLPHRLQEPSSGSPHILNIVLNAK